jgi:hypothetical protein
LLKILFRHIWFGFSDITKPDFKAILSPERILFWCNKAQVSSGFTGPVFSKSHCGIKKSIFWF